MKTIGENNCKAAQSLGYLVKSDEIVNPCSDDS